MGTSSLGDELLSESNRGPVARSPVDVVPIISLNNSRFKCLAAAVLIKPLIDSSLHQEKCKLNQARANIMRWQVFFQFYFQKSLGRANDEQTTEATKSSVTFREANFDV